MAPETATTTEKRAFRKTRTGIVVSTKMNKTITVSIERQVPHPLYRKYFKKTKKFLAHDEHETAALGDKVLIMETRPLSRHKRWRLVRIVERAR
ncbi:MAG: 30S ribosomal protein S17 [Ignavibacteriae bacterium]|nr:30S ribosomal protein S17 [Ignavibacteriota bacterium]